MPHIDAEICYWLYVISCATLIISMCVKIEIDAFIKNFRDAGSK